MRATRTDQTQQQHRLRGLGRCRVGTLLVGVATSSFVPACSASIASAAVATPARSFMDSVCVATHLHYSDTPYYRRWPKIRDALVEARIRHVRDAQLDRRVWSFATVSARWRELADRGVRATLGPYPGNLARKVALAAQNPAVEAIEGPNELDQSGTGWRTRLLRAQRAIWHATRAQPNLVDRPVLVGALAFSDRWSRVTSDLKAYFTHGNLHVYPGGETPGSNLSAQFAATAAAFGGAPVQVTETGYHNAVSAPGTQAHRPTSARAIGIYVPQLYLEYFRRGIQRSCLYELVDEWADPGKDNRESRFGLLRHDLTPKSAYTRLKRLIQAGGARRILARDPGRAVEAAALIERTGRDALDEMRHLLGVLHPGEHHAELAPQPTLIGIESLVDRSRGAGLPVELRVAGERRELSPGVDLAAYRVIQEALTNSLKHGGGRATVTVEYDDAELRIAVTDMGSGRRARVEGGGHGLVGMRERVRVCGGELRAGPRPGGGFEVSAHLPLQDEAEAALAASAGRDTMEAA